MLGAGTLGRARVNGVALLFAGAVICGFLGTAVLAADSRMGIHEGVASCAGSTCHSRLLPSGGVVRQNELFTWQDRSSAAGAHSRSWRVLSEPLARAIAQRLGLIRAEEARECIGCHADPVPAAQRGTFFQISDGVGCESCHGGSGAWLPRHTLVGATHAGNIALGLNALDNPKIRAGLCLDCHYGSTKEGQFVSHKIMAAGHPRLSFELDLFSALQRHHDVDADYAKRKAVAGGIKTWSVGQAMALERALTVYGDGARGQNGAFPEFYFFDCQSCHRTISDDPKAKLTLEANPGRPIPAGMPPFNDENMIMLSALARVAAPASAARFEANAREFHAALARDRASAVTAAVALAGSARALGDAFAAHSFSRADIFAVLENVLSGAATRYTDYSGGAQAVMAADTLLNALVAEGQVERRGVDAIRPDIDRLYAALRDPNAFRPAEFREAIQRVAPAVRRLR